MKPRRPKPSPDHVPGCTRKVRYENRIAAREAVQAMAHRGVVRAYRCPSCGFYHLTSEPRKPR